jgi:hypothetical protein
MSDKVREIDYSINAEFSTTNGCHPLADNFDDETEFSETDTTEK